MVIVFDVSLSHFLGIVKGNVLVLGLAIVSNYVPVGGTLALEAIYKVSNCFLFVLSDVGYAMEGVDIYNREVFVSFIGHTIMLQLL